MNPILLTDSYKVTHWKQYPPGTTRVYSYFESRGGAWPETVFFGLQYLLKEFLTRKVNYTDTEEAYEVFEKHFGRNDLFYLDGWKHIVEKHRGQLPLVIKAVPEGTVVPTHNVLMTVENTCPHCHWLTNYVETILSQVWYPMTVATTSREIKRLIAKYLDLTADNREGLEFKLHDFGFRGVSSVESAGIGGCAHLVSFQGTDTLAALGVARNTYGETCAGFAIPAAEHSTITSWGKDYELAAYENMLRQFPDRLVAVVSDSYDIYAAVEKLWGEFLHDRVMQRKGTVVIRPDSGYPPTVVCRILKLLAEKFGTLTNRKGFLELPPQVRVIQGDGVDYDMIRNVLHAMYEQKFSATNIAFGMGGALLQKLNRDTQKCAFKCAAIEKEGMWWPVSKNPVTDPSKKSMAGHPLRLIHVDPSDTSWKGEMWYTTASEHYTDHDDLLTEVYRDGDIKQFHTLAQIRERAKISAP